MKKTRLRPGSLPRLVCSLGRGLGFPLLSTSAGQECSGPPHSKAAVGLAGRTHMLCQVPFREERYENQKLDTRWTHCYWVACFLASSADHLTHTHIDTHTHKHTYTHFRNDEFTPVLTILACIRKATACFPPFCVCMSLLPL